MGRKTGAQKMHKERVGKEVKREKKFSEQSEKGKEGIKKVGMKRKLEKTGAEVTAAARSLCAPSERRHSTGELKELSLQETLINLP